MAEMVINSTQSINPSFGHLWGVPLTYNGQYGSGWVAFLGGYGLQFSGQTSVLSDEDGNPIGFTATLDGSFTLFTNGAVVGSGTMPSFTYTSTLSDGDYAQSNGDGGWLLGIHGADVGSLGPFGEFVAGLERIVYNGASGDDYFDGSYIDTSLVAHGGDGVDSLFGAFRHANQVYGEGGNDVVWGQGVGDYVDGGDGNDFVFDGDSSGDGTIPTPPQDTYNSDTLIGGDGDDQVLSSGGGDHLEGGAGNDHLEVAGDRQDDDTLIGGIDDDWINGGLGTDTAIFSGSRAQYTISPVDMGLEAYSVVGPDGSDTLIGIEQLRFDDGTFTIGQLMGWPVITSDGGSDTAAVSIDENTTAVTTVTATDPDVGQTLTYSISGGDDAPKFQIDAMTGLLSFVAAPDHENPADTGADNVYEVIVQVSDGQGGVDTQAISVSVTDAAETVNQAPSFVRDGKIEIAMTVQAGVRILNLLPDGSAEDSGLYLPSDTFSYFASSGDVDRDGDRDILVSGDNGSGRLYLNNGDNTFSDSGARFPGQFQSDNALVDTDLDGDLDALFHNGLGNINVYRNNGGDSFTQVQSIDPGRAASGYAASRGFVTGDLNGDNYSDLYVPLGNTAAHSDVPLVLINDGTGHFVEQPQGLPSEAAMRPAVGDVDGDGDLDILYGGSAIFSDSVPGDGAVLLNDGNGNFTVGQSSFGAADTSAIELGDVDGDGDIDAIVRSSSGLALWKNDGAGGFQLHHSVKSGDVAAYAMTDFDGDGDIDLTYSAANLVQSLVNDGQGNFTASGTSLPTSGYVFAFLGNDFLSDVNQSPEIAENSTAVTTVAATDPDGDALVYSIIGGEDAGKFQIDAQTGVLGFIVAPDFDNPGDTDANNEYLVEVQATDGNGGTVAQAIRVTVTNRNDNAPVFSSGAAATIAENTIGAAYTSHATDADNLKALIYTLAGTDAALFDIDSATGIVTFKSAPDFESPADADGDNVYDIVVKATDGLNATPKNVAINVTNTAGATYAGTSANNVFTGTAEEDTIRGLGGADTLSGLAGDDLIDGGSGNDVLNGGAGKDTLLGGIGVDRLDGGAGDDAMQGGAGNDTYVVGETNDVVTELEGEGTDTVETPLAVYVLPANVENLVFRGSVDFQGTGNALANTLTGGAGGDVLDGAGGADRLVGLGGDDTYLVDAATDAVVEATGGGLDTVYATASSCTLAANVEVLRFAGTGSFTGTGNGLANLLFGGDQNDHLQGAGGNDEILGAHGADEVSGGSGDDTFLSSVNDGNDLYFGDAGRDSFSLDGLQADALVDLLNGSATSGDTGTDQLNSIENAIGGAGNDKIVASTVRNILTGGSGLDTFVFASIGAAGKGTSADIITDFSSGDRIDVSQIDANGTLAGNPAFLFAGEITTVSGGYGQLGRGQIGYRYQTDANGVDHTIIEGNTNPNAEADFQIDLIGRIQLAAGDFLL